MKARQIVITEPYKVDVREVALPDPAANQVLVQTEGQRLTRLPVAELLPAAFSRSAPEQP